MEKVLLYWEANLICGLIQYVNLTMLSLTVKLVSQNLPLFFLLIPLLLGKVSWSPLDILQGISSSVNCVQILSPGLSGEFSLLGRVSPASQDFLQDGRETWQLCDLWCLFLEH